MRVTGPEDVYVGRVPRACLGSRRLELGMSLSALDCFLVVNLECRILDSRYHKYHFLDDAEDIRDYGSRKAVYATSNT